MQEGPPGPPLPRVTLPPPREGVLGNIRWLTAANFVVKPLWFVFVLFSARLLGPEQFGVFMLAIAFVSVTGAFFDGGVDIHAVRHLANDPGDYRRFAAHSLTLKVVLGTATGLVAAAAAAILQPGSLTVGLLAAAAVYIVAVTVMTHARFLFRAFEVMRFEAYSLGLEKAFVFLLCGAVLLLVPRAAEYGTAYATAYLLAAAATLAMLVRVMGLPRLAWDRAYLWRSVLRPALPYALMNVFLIVYPRTGTLMLNGLTGDERLVGYYNAGYRLIEAFVLFPSVIVGPLYPALSRHDAAPEAIQRRTYDALRVILVVALVIALPVAVLHGEFTHLFYGDAYAGAAGALGLIILAIIPVGMNWVFGTLVAARGRQSRGNVFIVACTALNLALHVWLIPRFGLMGAAAATLVTECALAVSNFWVVRDILRVSEIGGLMLKLAAVVPVLLLLRVTVLPHLPFAPACAVVVLSIAALAFVLRVVAVKDVVRFVRPG